MVEENLTSSRRLNLAGSPVSGRRPSRLGFNQPVSGRRSSWLGFSQPVSGRRSSLLGFSHVLEMAVS